MSLSLPVRVKNIFTYATTNAWVILLFFASAPLLVGSIQAELRSWPELDPFLGNSIKPWLVTLQISFPYITTLLLVGSGILFIFRRKKFIRWPPLLKNFIFVILLTFMIILLWVSLDLVSLFVHNAHVNRNWFFYLPAASRSIQILRWLWTIGLIIMVTKYYQCEGNSFFP